MGMGFAPTWLRQVSPPPLHMTTLTTGSKRSKVNVIRLESDCLYAIQSHRALIDTRQMVGPSSVDDAPRFLLSLCGSVAYSGYIGRWTCDQRVARSTPGRRIAACRAATLDMSFT